MFDLCNVKKLPVLDDVREIFPMIWRFFPMLDLQVDILMSRDLDSLINERESAAVKDWIKSPYALHVMRDHPLHKKEILGGLFGIKLGICPLFCLCFRLFPISLLFWDLKI